MIKINRTAVILTANIAVSISIKDGIDYYDTEFNLSYSPNLCGKIIEVTLKTRNLQTVSRKVILNDLGYDTFQFNNDIESLGIDSNFESIEFLSSEDITIEFSAEVPEGNFFP